MQPTLIKIEDRTAYFTEGVSFELPPWLKWQRKVREPVEWAPDARSGYHVWTGRYCAMRGYIVPDGTTQERFVRTVNMMGRFLIQHLYDSYNTIERQYWGLDLPEELEPEHATT